MDTLGHVLLRYGSLGGLTANRASILLKTINAVSIIQLKDYDRPLRIYQRFMEENPDHRLNKLLAEIIDELAVLKSKNLEAANEKP